MSVSALTGAGLGLAASAVWGGGDFCGGLAARHQRSATVVAAVALSGTLLLSALALLRGEPVPADGDLAWSVAAGVSGALGLALLYRALAIGRAAVVAPTAAVIGATVPVAWGLLAAQPPAPAQLAGFALAGTGIALVTHTRGLDGHRPLAGIGAAIAAGVALGGFLVLMAQVGRGSVFAPLVAARVVMLAAASCAMLAARIATGGRPWRSEGLALALLGGLLDAAGNALYLLATHAVRIDVAGVLASLYPVSTVLLARTLLGQPVSTAQWAGVAACAAAVVLIAG